MLPRGRPSHLLLGAALVALVACAKGNPSPASSPARATGVAIATAPALPAPAPRPAKRAPTFSYSGELTQGGWIRGTAPEGTIRLTLGEQSITVDEYGAFFAAFDRDQGNQAALVATLADGRRVTETIPVSPRDWQIEHVDVSRTGGRTSEEFWKIREPEWNAIRDARSKRTGAQGWKQDFIWPVNGRISGRFGRQRIYRGEPGSYHSGIDIAPGNGVPFVAPADGTVVLARTGFSLEGGLIIIDHGMGLNSAFLHASKVAVEEGETVRQGQHIGNVGATGRATGPHLHWSLMWQDARLDPLLFTGPMN